MAIYGYAYTGSIFYQYLSQVNFSQLKGLIYQDVQVLSSSDPSLTISDDYGSLSNFVSLCRANDLEAIISLLGLSSLTTLKVGIQSASFRSQLIQNLISIVNTYGLDGVDVNNEQIPHASNGTYQNLFVQELTAALHAIGKKICLTVGYMECASYWGALPAATINACDRFQIMLYDFDSNWYGTYAEVLNYLEKHLARGITPGLVYMGINFAARSSSDSWQRYGKIVDQYSLTDTSLNTVGGYSFNGVDLVRQKAELAKSKGLGGIFELECQMDKLGSGSMSLQNAIFEVLGENGGNNEPENPELEINIVAGENTLNVVMQPL